jgi:ribonuclease R
MNKKKADKKKKHSSSKNSSFRGKVEITRSGMAFVTVENMNRDVLVRPHHLNTALNGDVVEVTITKEGNNGRNEGTISKILERKQVEFIGKLQFQKHHIYFIPESDRPMPDIHIATDKTSGAVNNDKVVVKLIEWNKDRRLPEGEVLEVIKDEDANDLAMKQLLLQGGFSLSFSDETLEEASRLPEIISKEEEVKRRDFRNTLTFTIDPVDAKDFDDALSIKPLSNDLLEIGVHIADVSHFVQPGMSLDDEGYDRATSVYLPDRVNPMLPERISNELCSLRPHEDKYTFSAVFTMSNKGDVKDVWLGRTIIHSNHRYTYEEVQQIIESGAGLHKDEILLLNKLAQKMRKDRFKKGAINFSSQEVRFVLDKNKKPVGITVKESKESHQLIEEFMLLANKYVAQHISRIHVKDKPVPFPYRVHDTPDEEKLLPFISFAKKYGHRFDNSSPEKIATSFNQLLSDVKGKPEQHVLETLGIRTMAKAVYTAENIGHYGLGFEHYCHFTSPIRRYPDVMVHRILQQCLDGEPQIDKKMEQKCRHCSERERAAMEAERAANKYKQVEYMSEYLGEDFDGVVSGVASFGFWVETVEHKCEGLVSLYSLSELDDFRYIEEDYCLVGKRSGKTFRIGEKVRIKVIAANLEKRQLDYELVVPNALQTGREERSPAKVHIKKKKQSPKQFGQKKRQKR